ncbi:MAG: hypothetical protein P8X42_04440 [Calditrichaceae bacterium]|jgi:hypothetical protein
MAKHFFAFTTIFLLNLYNIVPGQTNLLNLLDSLMEKEQRIGIIQDSLSSLQKQAVYDTTNNLEGQISDLKVRHAKLTHTILAIKSEIFDHEKTEPVWVEGEAEIIQDDEKSIEQNKRLVLMFARRDAMEKGGKILVETLTSLKQIEIDSESESGIENKYVEEYRSIIRSKGKVKVVDQDLGGDYGNVIKIEEDGKNKLKARVRLKVVSMDEINPYKYELEKEE